MAAEGLIAAMHRSRDTKALSSLASALGTVCARLDGEKAATHAGKAVDPLVVAIGDSRNASDLYLLLLPALRAVSPRLSPAKALETANNLLDALHDPNTNTFFLTQALLAICSPYGSPEIVRILQHPLATGQAQRALLELLERPTKRSFRSPWEFIDWAAANGVDLLPETAATAKR
jgi:hypothetical protein